MELVIALVAGFVGGNGTGRAARRFDLGIPLNSVLGALGGLCGGLLLMALGPGDGQPLIAGTPPESGGIGDIVAGLIGGAAGGAALTMAIALIRARGR